VIAGGQTRISTKALGPINNASAVYVGAKDEGSDFFPGAMDSARIEIGQVRGGVRVQDIAKSCPGMSSTSQPGGGR
jgi:hypothetical protein